MKLPISIVVLFAFFLPISQATAFTMSNSNFSIQNTSVSTQTNQSASSSPTLPKPQQIKNITIDYGIFGTNPKQLTLSLDTDLIDFGPLSPTNPVVRNSTLTLTNLSQNGVSIFGFENHPLLSQNIAAKSDSSALIPDTSCDDGTCTETRASSWQDILTYGFGFRCGNGVSQACAETLNSSSDFVPFSVFGNTKSLPEFAHTSVSKDKENIQIIYKVNIATTQKLGSYENTVSYIEAANL